MFPKASVAGLAARISSCLFRVAAWSARASKVVPPGDVEPFGGEPARSPFLPPGPMLSSSSSDPKPPPEARSIDCQLDRKLSRPENNCAGSPAFASAGQLANCALPRPHAAAPPSARSAASSTGFPRAPPAGNAPGAAPMFAATFMQEGNADGMPNGGVGGLEDYQARESASRFRKPDRHYLDFLSSFQRGGVGLNPGSPAPHLH